MDIFRYLIIRCDIYTNYKSDDVLAKFIKKKHIDWTIVHLLKFSSRIESFDPFSFCLLQVQMFTSFQWKLFPCLAFSTFQTEYYFFGSFSLFVEDWFSLTSVSRLFSVITTLTLGSK